MGNPVAPLSGSIVIDLECLPALPLRTVLVSVTVSFHGFISSFW